MESRPGDVWAGPACGPMPDPAIYAFGAIYDCRPAQPYLVVVWPPRPRRTIGRPLMCGDLRTCPQPHSPRRCPRVDDFLVPLCDWLQARPGA